MIDISEKITDRFELEKTVTMHSNHIPCFKCINFEKCNMNRIKPNTLKCRDELRDTYKENRYEGLVVAVERAVDWNVPPTSQEKMVYDAYIKLKKELESCVA
ncbi:MAG: hypothetical protein IJZ96_09110 [Lachnospiraceae bacterium]|nr:hypothetical protein [Lachnospiraceae bacterium]